MEYALNHHNLIPEIPHKVTSVTTDRGETVKTSAGDFIYRHIKPDLFTGYQLVAAQLPNRQVRLATPTKALFDWVYLDEIHPEETRLNLDVLKSIFDLPLPDRIINI